MLKDEFYVGYLNEAPTQTARIIKRTIIVLVVMVLGLSLIFAAFQKPFASTRYDYGVKTTVDGILYTTPVPHLEVFLGEVENQPLVQPVMLVGAGKMSAHKVIASLEKKHGKSLTGSRVELTGELIYGDGKALMQITEDDELTVRPNPSQGTESRGWTSNGLQQVSGEIVDPKCYFGVMKPGEGKPHRACAIRCIAGGIPPVLHTRDGEYFMLLNESSEPINSDVQSLVGDQITLRGETFLWNGWRILNVSTQNLRAMRTKKLRDEARLSFEEGLTFCKINR